MDARQWPRSGTGARGTEGKEKRGRDHQHGIMRGARSGAARSATLWFLATRQSKPKPRACGERFTPSIMWPSPPPRSARCAIRPARSPSIWKPPRSKGKPRNGIFHSYVFVRCRIGPGDTLPLDFNRYRNARGDFSRTRIALAAMARPFTVMPQLIEFDRNCRRAADALGDFLADCRF